MTEPVALEEFTKWLCREMPSGTIVSNPKWWAPRIFRAAHPAPAPAEPVAWEHLKPFGYAPGNYTGHCHDCGKEWIDQDKRAWTCRACAEKKYAIAHPAPAPAEHTKADAPIVSATNTCKPSEGAAAGAPDVAGLIERLRTRAVDYTRNARLDTARIVSDAAEALAALQSQVDERDNWLSPEAVREHYLPLPELVGYENTITQQAERITELNAKLTEAVGLLEKAYLWVDSPTKLSGELTDFLAKACEVMG